MPLDLHLGLVGRLQISYGPVVEFEELLLLALLRG